MRKTFTQKFYQQQKIQEHVAKKWGYSVAPPPFDLSKVSASSSRQVSINRSIQPRKIETVIQSKSPKHEDLLKQIAEMEHQKKMRKRAEDKNQPQLNIIKMMNDRIKQYNYLVDHKHIKQKNSEATKRVLKLKPKSQAQLIIDQIHRKNNELMKTMDIQKQFELNKNITELYRKYKQRMYDDKQQSRSFATVENSRLHRNIKQKQVERNRLRNNSECIPSYKYKLILSNNTECESQIEERKVENTQNINLEQPYLTREQIRKNNDFQIKSENSKEMMKIYKVKISKFIDKEKLSKTVGKFNAQEQSRSLDELEHSPKNERVMNRATPPPQPDHRLIQQLRQKKRKQEKYFSIFLEKRNRKFKKPWGNKILIKYDSSIQAKQMLSGSSSTISPNKTAYQDSFNKSFMNEKGDKKRTFRTNSKNLTEQDLMLLQNMRQEHKDQKIYEVMCKNEKINLFLKANKRNKH